MAPRSPGRLSNKEGYCVNAKPLGYKDTPDLDQNPSWGCVFFCSFQELVRSSYSMAPRSPGRLSNKEGYCVNAKPLGYKDTPDLDRNPTWGCFFFCSVQESLQSSKSMAPRPQEKPTYKAMPFSMDIQCSRIRKSTKSRRATLLRGTLP